MNQSSANTSIRIIQIILLPILLFVWSCASDPEAEEVRGCTNPAADNFMASANVDDGSCRISGCTDPAAENYDVNATDDDGSCEFPKDKFIGEYLGGFMCPGLFSVINQDSVEFEITDPVDPNEKAKVTISFIVTGIPISFEADVDGNDLTFDPLELTNIPIEIAGEMVEADLTFSGGATIDGNTLTAVISVTAEVLGLQLADECTLVGDKV